MNIEPWVRLGIRISPKISEKPADSRNNRPPNVTLLTVSSSQNVISADLPLSDPATSGLFLRSALRQRRIVARVNRVREELLFGPGPELADIFICLDGLVPKLEPVFGPLVHHAADVDVANHVVEVIELERTSRRVGEADRLERRHQLLLVVRIAAGRFQACVQHLAIAIEQGRILAGNGV